MIVDVASAMVIVVRSNGSGCISNAVNLYNLADSSLITDQMHTDYTKVINGIGDPVALTRLMRQID